MLAASSLRFVAQCTLRSRTYAWSPFYLPYFVGPWSLQSQVPLSPGCRPQVMTCRKLPLMPSVAVLQCCTVDLYVASEPSLQEAKSWSPLISEL